MFQTLLVYPATVVVLLGPGGEVSRTPITKLHYETALGLPFRVPKEWTPWVNLALQKMAGACNIEDGKQFPKYEAEYRILSAFATIGAHVGPDNKLYDSTGKEVFVSVHQGGGPPPIPLGPQEEAAWRLRREEFRKTFCVIDLPYLGPPIP